LGQSLWPVTPALQVRWTVFETAQLFFACFPNQTWINTDSGEEQASELHHRRPFPTANQLLTDELIRSAIRKSAPLRDSFINSVFFFASQGKVTNCNVRFFVVLFFVRRTIFNDMTSQIKLEKL
jgi:hypothetical protein